MGGWWNNLWQRRDLLGILIVRNLKIRYKGSFLGFFWSLLSPLLLIIIYGVFAAILRFNENRPNYLQFLVIGITCWQFLSMCLNDSLYAVLGNGNLVKKTAFPRLILPLAMVSANLVNFMLTWCVLFPYLLIVRMPMQHLYFLPLILLFQTMLALGLALMLSASNVFFRDTEHILGTGTLAWFFLSPIMYPIELQLDFLSERLQWLVFLNPMTGILYAYRQLLMSTGMPDVQNLPLSYLGISGGICLVVLGLGFWIYQSAQARFGDVM